MTVPIAGTNVLSGGSYYLPSETDNGKIIAETLETFMTRMAGHKHDGVDGFVQNFSALATEYASPTWVPIGSPVEGYYADLTLAGGNTYLQSGYPITYSIYSWDGAKYIPTPLEHGVGTAATQIRVYSNTEFTKLYILRY